MEKVTKFDLGEYFYLPNPGLLAYFKHTDEGSNMDIRPPFWDGEPREEVVSRWHSELFKSAAREVPGLLDYEEEMMSKIGPLSIQEPLSERISKIEEYYTDVLLPSDPIAPEAIERFTRKLRPIKAQLRNEQNTIANMRLSTNSGARYFRKRRDVLGLPGWDDMLTKTGEQLPAVLGWRGQEGGPDPQDVKQRVLFMFPFYYNVKELQAYQPLIEMWQHYHINPAYESMRAVEEKITRLFDTKGDDYCVVTDFTGFDQHFNKPLQDAAQMCIKYQLHKGEEWLENIFPIKYEIPLVCDDHLMYKGKHGMGSGSGGTNFDESCSHGCMQEEAALIKGKLLNPNSNAYGDDGYLSYPGIDVDDVISIYTSHGQVMNPSKQSVDKHSAVYLRRYFHDSYRDKGGIMLGSYPTMRALGRLLGQERFVSFEKGSGDYARYTVLRALGILENCNNHPAFEQFVDFVLKGDSYKLGLAVPGFFDSLGRQYKEFASSDANLLSYTQNLQMGEKYSSINNWKVVKYLRSKL